MDLGRNGMDYRPIGMGLTPTEMDSRVTGTDSKVTGTDSSVTEMDSRPTGINSIDRRCSEGAHMAMAYVSTRIKFGEGKHSKAMINDVVRSAFCGQGN